MVPSADNATAAKNPSPQQPSGLTSVAVGVDEVRPGRFACDVEHIGRLGARADAVGANEGGGPVGRQRRREAEM